MKESQRGAAVSTLWTWSVYVAEGAAGGGVWTGAAPSSSGTVSPSVVGRSSVSWLLNELSSCLQVIEMTIIWEGGIEAAAPLLVVPVTGGGREQVQVQVPVPAVTERDPRAEEQQTSGNPLKVRPRPAAPPVPDWCWAGG